MAVTGTKTTLDIINFAAQKAGITALGESASADVASHALIELNQMVKAWQNEGYMLWTKTNGSLDLNTAPATSYTLSPARPLRILSARYKNTAGNELPMIQLTRDEYDELPNKDSTGTPTQFYYDRQREAAKLYVWPILSAAAAVTIEYTYERELEDLTSTSDTLDLPGEWWDAAAYNLAARLMESVPLQRQNPLVPQRAQKLLNDALAFDREGSVYFRMGGE